MNPRDMTDCVHSIARSRRPACRGFTLIEIMAVVIILAIIAALALPNLQTQDDLNLSAAARIVVADLLYAQSQAIATGSARYVNFTTAANASDGSYSLYDNSTLATPINNPITQEVYTTQFGEGSVGPLVSVGLTGLSFISPGNTVLVFSSLGAPSVCPMSNTASLTPLTNDATITMECGSMSVTVSIEPNTGNITVSSVATH